MSRKATRIVGYGTVNVYSTQYHEYINQCMWMCGPGADEKLIQGRPTEAASGDRNFYCVPLISLIELLSDDTTVTTHHRGASSTACAALSQTESGLA